MLFLRKVWGMKNFMYPLFSNVLCRVKILVLPFASVFLTCTPPGDGGAGGEYLSWVKEMNVPADFAAGKIMKAGAKIELKFDRKLQKVSLKNQWNQDLIVISLTRRFRDKDILVWFRVHNKPVPAPVPAKPNWWRIDLSDFDIAKVGATDDNGVALEVDRATLSATFTEMTFEGTIPNNLRIINFPRLRKGDTFSLILLADALMDQNGRQNEPEKDIFVKTIP